MTPQEFVDTELKLVKQMFDTQKSIVPMVVMVKDDHRAMMQAEFHSDAQKDSVSQGIKDLVKRSEPDVVVYMAEAWMIKMNELPPEIPRLPLPRPSSHPNRTEIIIVQIEFKTGEKFGCIADILRNGSDAQLGKFEITGTDMSSGRFVDFFPQKMN
jgi:hypothetical protein